VMMMMMMLLFTNRSVQARRSGPIGNRTRQR
jgi:hypothetical protein